MAKNDLKPKKMKRKAYETELAKLEVELVKLQGWIKEKGLKIAVIFEGRDSAGKGGVIKRISAADPDGEGKDAVVFSALHPSPAFSRGDGALRPQLVQPCRGGEGDGILHG
jgi:polyphosphate kinase 2 (PPK2 family)